MMEQRIMEAAKNEIARYGLKFTIRDLAARLAVSTKTIYQYFESKERIIESIVALSINEMREAEAVVIEDSSLTTLQKLNKALGIIPEWFIVSDIRILQEFKQRYPKQWAEIDEHVTLGWDRIRMLADEGIKEGSLRPFDMDMFIHIYVGGLYQLMESRGAGKTALPLEQALAQMVEMLLHGIAVKEG